GGARRTGRKPSRRAGRLVVNIDLDSVWLDAATFASTRTGPAARRLTRTDRAPGMPRAGA
ncbi:hypothetical protein, partial [Dactylosporangium sp. NPDC050588]|uniref:hypothetical protein n=1 Tax=Dactylosporangium sp. NPDC050588 TaxID=3157211 RepID=UPI0033F66C3B